MSVLEPICISVPNGIVVRGCIWLQWICFEDSFNTFSHFMMGDLWAHLPTPCWVFSSFRPKCHDPCAPPSLFTQSCPEWPFLFCYPRWKSPKREMFEVKQKNSRSTKRHRNQWVQKLFWAVGKNVSISILRQMESTWKATEVKMYKNKYTIFYK